VPGNIRFQHRALLDAVIAYVDWSLETEDDVIAWHEAFTVYFGPLRRKFDLILECSSFRVNPRILSIFTEHRIAILRAYTLRSYRVRQQPAQKAILKASTAQIGTAPNEYDTIDAALAALLHDRAQAPRATE
jgi:hypothetical protein